MKYPAGKILLIATRQIGDVLLITPLLRALRQAYPEAIIDVVVYAGKGAILVGNPDYNTLISVAEHPNFSQYVRLLRRIFRHYDLAISTLPGDRPLLYTLLAAPKRVAIVPPARWQDAWKRLIVQEWTELDNNTTHTVIQNLRLADALDIQRCYEVVVPQDNQATDKLNRLLPFRWQSETFAVLHLLPMWHYKRWTLNGWRALAHYLTQSGLPIVLTGGGDEQELDYLQQAMSKMPDTAINLAGELNFAEVARLISAAKVYIGPDTCVTHLAAATGTPTIALYGPTNPLKWAPWPKGYSKNNTPFQHKGSQQIGNVVLIQGESECVPCHQEGCHRHRKSTSRCLEELTSNKVIQAVRELLNLQHPKPIAIMPRRALASPPPPSP